VVGATAVGLALRLYRLGEWSLSSPEIYTWDLSNHSVSFILNRLSLIETNPPFYYLLMKPVMLMGDSEFLLRVPSVIAGTLAIPLVYILGRVGGAPAGDTIGAGLMALSAFNITYSRQARAYTLAEDLCLLATIGVATIIGCYQAGARDDARIAKRELKGWIVLTVSAIAGFYLHYTFLIELTILQCAFLVARFSGTRFDRPFLAKWLVSGVLMVLAMGWGLELAHGQTHSEDLAWIQNPSLVEALQLLLRVDGYGALARFEPWPDLSLLWIAVVGVAAGWDRSAARLIRRESLGNTVALLLLSVPAAISAVNSLKRPNIWEPYARQSRVPGSGVRAVDK
jgi:hypothetical protein